MVSLQKPTFTVVAVESRTEACCSHCGTGLGDGASKVVELEMLLCDTCAPVYSGMVRCIRPEKMCLYNGCMVRRSCVLHNVMEASPAKVSSDLLNNQWVNLSCPLIERVRELGHPTK